MGCIPACGSNRNSRNVSCSQPRECPLHYINGRSIKKCLKRSDNYKLISEEVNLIADNFSLVMS